MQCQILFSRKDKKNISKCCLLKLLPSMQSVNIHEDFMTSFGFFSMKNICDWSYKGLCHCTWGSLIWLFDCVGV